MNAEKVLLVMENSPYMRELLEKDLKHTEEVGMMLDKEGNTAQVKVGKTNQVTLINGSQSIMIHTHPSIDTTMNDKITLSESDLDQVGKDKSISASVVLVKSMFDPYWDGVVAYGENGERRRKFRIDVEGVMDGPSRERKIESFEFVY